MAHFSFTVDTTPMADEIGSVANHVNGTTTAVVAMESAVIAAEHKASEIVCQNVNQGFHRLIRSQISQKKVLAQTEAGAKLIELRRFALSLRNVRDQLNADFQRITSRYSRLFRSLDEALASRIFKLDTGAFSLADRQLPQLTQRVSNVGTPMIVHHAEVRDTSDSLTVSRLKKDALNLMANADAYIQKGNTLKSAVSEMVQSAGASTLTWVYTPVLMLETDDIYMPDNKATSIIMGSVSSTRGSELIRRRLDEVQADMKWQAPTQQDSEAVKRICRQKLSSVNTDARLARLMQELMEKSSWQVLKEAS
jgi:hypothetical protein